MKREIIAMGAGVGMAIAALTIPQAHALPHESCAPLIAPAESIMQSRQNGVAYELALSGVPDRFTIRGIRTIKVLDEAYSRPRLKSSEAKRASSIQFGQWTYLECLNWD